MNNSKGKRNHKGNYPRRGREGKRESKRSVEEVPPRYRRTGENDVNWYTRYPELTVASASIPYVNRPGMGVRCPGIRGNTMESDFQIPGVMGLEWIPTLGRSRYQTDPASLVAREVFSKVRDKYSGSLEADPPDFVMYLLALDSIYSYIAWLKRLYRTLNAYTPQNYAFPDAILSAMGLYEAEIQTIRQDRVTLWQDINELISMTKKFMCPAEFDFMNRHYWMNDNVYTDSNSVMAQVYLFTQAAWYKYAELNTPDDVPAAGVTLVKPSRPNDTDRTVDFFYNFGRELIDSLSAWDDCYTINGYLQRAYEGSPTFTVDLLAQDEMVMPMYVPEVLSQIENIKSVPFSTYSADVTQDPKRNLVLCSPVGTTDVNDIRESYWQAYSDDDWLNVRSDNPTVADTVIATRLHPVFTKDKVEGSAQYWTWESGTEIIVNMTLNYTNYLDRNEDWTVPFSQMLVYNHVSDPGTTIPFAVRNLVRVIGALTSFSQHPLAYFAYVQNSAIADMKVGMVKPICDVHNLTTLNPNQLRQIHRICVLSEWNAYNT